MIHKNIKYGNVEYVTVIEFGKGTLSIVDAENDEHLSILIKTKEYSPIGEVTGNETSSDEFKPEIAIVFNNKESFDVFLEFVENIKTKFYGGSPSQKYDTTPYSSTLCSCEKDMKYCNNSCNTKSTL